MVRWGFASFFARAFALLLLPATAFAQQISLSDIALFYRCYALITRSHPAPNNPHLADVLANRRGPIDACVDVLDKAAFDSRGYMFAPNDPEARKVVDTMYTFFMTVFRKHGLGDRPQTYSSGEIRHNDPTLPALRFLRVFFRDEPVETLVTSPNAIRGRRSAGSYITTGKGSSTKHVKLAHPDASLERGHPIGVTLYAPDNHTYLADNGKAYSSQWVDWRSYQVFPRRNWLAGLIGPTLFMMYSGLERGGDSDDPKRDPNQTHKTVSNGSLTMVRRKSRAIFSALLCKDEPPIRKTDANPYVVSYLKTHPGGIELFRRDATCYQCHHSYGNMAAVMAQGFCTVGRTVDWNGNGKVNSRTPADRIDGGDSTQFCTLSSTTNSGRPAPAQPQHLQTRDRYFFTRAPRGRLVFRDYKGQLIDIPIVGTNGFDGFRKLGQAIASTDQFHACMAKRFVEFATGLNVRLTDPGDPSMGPPTAEEIKYRLLIDLLASDLKRQKSLRTLLINILRSPLVRNSGFRL